METPTHIEPSTSDRLGQHMSLESYLNDEQLTFGDEFMHHQPQDLTARSSSIPQFMQTQNDEDDSFDALLPNPMAEEDSEAAAFEGELTADFDDENFIGNDCDIDNEDSQIPDFDALEGNMGLDDDEIVEEEEDGDDSDDSDDEEEGEEDDEESEDEDDNSEDGSGEETDDYFDNDNSGDSKSSKQQQDAAEHSNLVQFDSTEHPDATPVDSIENYESISTPFDGVDPEAKSKQKPTETCKKRKRKEKKKKSDRKKKKMKKIRSQRKNIRKIMKEANLDACTLAAQNEELERQMRIKELKMATHVQQPLYVAAKKPEKDSELKSLLQAAETDATAREKNDDVILVDRTVNNEKVEPKDVIELSSDEDDVVMLPDSKEDNEIEEEDPNNGGSHVNDALNKPNQEGKVLVNMGHPPEDPDIFLPPQIARVIKPHQIGGVRFLYDNLVESMTRFKTSSGFGCILAHSMGLGKTIQMISFIDMFLRYTTARTVMCVVPINTLQNWNSEFDRWLPVRPEFPQTADQNGNENFGQPNVQTDGQSEASDIGYRRFRVYLLNESFKTVVSRAKMINEWYKTGGVLLMGYEMYRLLSSRKVSLGFPKLKKSKKSQPFMIDLDEEDHNRAIVQGLYNALVNPGPDLIVCDEGHRIKNSLAGISQSLKLIRTRRRVALTGYPLQNNMIEYWCMVDFVRPNFLGNKTEFSNMFERPIANGQCMDSTIQDLRIMRYRAHVLHSLLEGFVQRRGHTVLQEALPPKTEFVLLIRLSPMQRKLYKTFMNCIEDPGFFSNCNPLKAFAVCCKIWNHPDVLHKIIHKNRATALEDNDLDIEDSRNSADKGANLGRKRAVKPKTATFGFDGLVDRRSDQAITYEWAEAIMEDYQAGQLEMGGKFVILFDLIEQTIFNGEKILVFSQSLFTLSLLEEFLSKFQVPRSDMDENWCKNRNYFRLDGSTSALEREKLINAFNAEDNDRVWLFLLSTRAGSLGVNLVAANRVVVLDASWNPCHDCQAICRVYRFGQDKPTYIYRLVTDNTLEKKIYERQIKKQGISDRVVDEMNPENKFIKGQVDKLMEFQEEKEAPVIDFSKESYLEDTILANVLVQNGHWLTENPFTHESLLIDRKELRLTKKEKQLAKQSYMMEKRLNVSHTRPSYTSFYPGMVRLRMPRSGMDTGRPVASVKPMISTPVPMHPKGGTVNNLVRPGVSIHQVITTTEITLPGKMTVTNTKGNTIPAGSKVHVIKTPKGVYLRTTDGKIFAVRSKIQTTGTASDPLVSMPVSSAITTTVSSNRMPVTHAVPPTKVTTETSSASDIISASTSSVSTTSEQLANSLSDLSSIFTQTNTTSSQMQTVPSLTSSYMGDNSQRLSNIPVPTQFQELQSRMLPPYPGYFSNQRLPLPMNIPPNMMGSTAPLLPDLPGSSSHNDILSQLQRPDPIMTSSIDVDASKRGRTGVIKPQQNFSAVQPHNYLDMTPNMELPNFPPQPGISGQHHSFPFSPYSFPYPSPFMFPTGMHPQGGEMNPPMSTNPSFAQGMSVGQMPMGMGLPRKVDPYSSHRLQDLANLASTIGAAESMTNEEANSLSGDLA